MYHKTHSLFQLQAASQKHTPHSNYRLYKKRTPDSKYRLYKKYTPYSNDRLYYKNILLTPNTGCIKTLSSLQLQAVSQKHTLYSKYKLYKKTHSLLQRQAV